MTADRLVATAWHQHFHSLILFDHRLHSVCFTWSSSSGIRFAQNTHFFGPFCLWRCLRMCVPNSPCLAIIGLILMWSFLISKAAECYKCPYHIWNAFHSLFSHFVDSFMASFSPNLTTASSISCRFGAKFSDWVIFPSPAPFLSLPLSLQFGFAAEVTIAW